MTVLCHCDEAGVGRLALPTCRHHSNLPHRALNLVLDKIFHRSLHVRSLRGVYSEALSLTWFLGRRPRSHLLILSVVVSRTNCQRRFWYNYHRFRSKIPWWPMHDVLPWSAALGFVKHPVNVGQNVVRVFRLVSDTVSLFLRFLATFFRARWRLLVWVWVFSFFFFCRTSALVALIQALLRVLPA